MRIAGRALVLGLAAGLLGGLGVVAARAQTSPTITVSPKAGTSGTIIKIAGQGFCGTAACSSVQVSFAGIVVADGVKVDPDGGFSLKVTVPGSIPEGEVAVGAMQTSATGQPSVAITTFQVTLAAPTGSPSPSGSASPSGSPSGTPSSSPSTTPSSTATSTPTPTLSPTPSPTETGGGTSPLLIVAMVLAAVAFLVGIGGVIYILWRSGQTPTPTSEPVAWDEGPAAAPPSEQPTAPVEPVAEAGEAPDSEPPANPPAPGQDNGSAG